ncbi:MAG: cytidylate kinase-like family protein [Thermodesulfobacteriota bacterium]
MPVVTISRQFGAGGHTLGEMVAQRFGYQLVDQGVIHQIAQEAKVSVNWVEAVEKETGGLVMRIVNSLVSSSFIERLLGEPGADFDEKKYVQFVKRIIRDIAREGDAVIVGRGAQFILPEKEDIIKVLLVADLEDRIKFMMEHYDLARAKAEELVLREEKRRTVFLKVFYPGDPDDPKLYTMVINTGRVSLAEAEDLVTGLLGRILDEHASPIW